MGVYATLYNMPTYNNIRIDISADDYHAFKVLLVSQRKTISKVLGDYIRGYIARHNENKAPLSVEVHGDTAK